MDVTSQTLELQTGASEWLKVIFQAQVKMLVILNACMSALQNSKMVPSKVSMFIRKVVNFRQIKKKHLKLQSSVIYDAIHVICNFLNSFQM